MIAKDKALHFVVGMAGTVGLSAAVGDAIISGVIVIGGACVWENYELLTNKNTAVESTLDMLASVLGVGLGVLLAHAIMV